jgi:copper chaperone NosL
MLISSAATGGEIVSAGSDPRFYDDIGCVAADSATPGSAGDGTRTYVRVSGRDEWIEAGRAHYAQPAEAQTPMGSGVMAFATADEARAADRAGRALTWHNVVNGDSPQGARR